MTPYAIRSSRLSGAMRTLASVRVAMLCALSLLAGCSDPKRPAGATPLTRYPLGEWHLIQGFGVWNSRWQAYHLAEDAAAAAGTMVFAAGDGTVLLAEEGLQGYGAIVLVSHESSDGPLTSLYGHLSGRRGLTVRTGDRIRAGDPIGTIADDDEDGGDWAPHLHFGVRRGASSIDDELCGNWPYVGYTRACPGLTHEQHLALWRSPSETIGKASAAQ